MIAVMAPNPWTITPQDAADQIDNAHYASLHEGWRWFEYRRYGDPRGEYPGDHVANGGLLLVLHRDAEDEESTPAAHYLKLDDIKAAIHRYAELQKRTPRDVLENGDGGDSDNIMQLAVLGEIVYG